jgi:carbamoyltransferase
VNIVRSSIPAATHVDYSARVQTVDRQRNPRLHRVMETFEKTTGCPVLVNTSFNVRGEPIVCTPEDAYRCFAATEMDALVLGDFIILKTQIQKGAVDEKSRTEYLAQFQLD